MCDGVCYVTSAFCYLLSGVYFLKAAWCLLSKGCLVSAIWLPRPHSHLSQLPAFCVCVYLKTYSFSLQNNKSISDTMMCYVASYVT
jgi:hypothetical protein